MSHSMQGIHFYITSAMTSYIPTCWKGNFDASVHEAGPVNDLLYAMHMHEPNAREAGAI